MRTTIDHKVVEMKFDNSKFEKNVAQTMQSLDKLKEKLKFSNASKGLENVNSAASKLNFSGMTTAIESIRTKFGALEVVGLTALTNIANTAVNAGKRIVSALTIDPIKTGFSEYETKINAIQTIMSNTASKGTTMDDVTRTLNELNLYADKTIYNFAEMTRNIGTFTAAGVGLEESASAIQGIANLAAASGSTSQQASTAMYQLSQALASGTVKLMDWNSVVNAGMGGQKFQEALKATAREHGVAVDEIIKKEGSFRESLSQGWATAEILNETLSKFTVEGAKKYSDAMMESGKWTQAQADALMKEAQSMEDAATKVKTFTQLWSTLQESAQSGWAQSWEIIVGNFEEAKELLTKVSDVIGGMLSDSANARNDMLQGWKDMGGRQVLIDALGNAFDGIMSVVKPIKEAFREIFPPTTAKQLLAITEKFKEITSKMKLSEKTSKNLKATFKGLFAVIDVGLTIGKKLISGALKLLSNFTGLIKAILAGTGALGDWVSGMHDSIESSNTFGKVIDGVVNFLQKGIDKLKEFGSSLREGFRSNGYEGFVGFLKAIWGLISSIGAGVAKAFGGLGKAISEAFGENSVSDVFSSGAFTAFLIGLARLVNNLNAPFAGLSKTFKKFAGKDGVLDNVTEVLDGVRQCLQAYQMQLKAKALLSIAAAVGILAASIFAISKIDPGTLGTALGGITVLFGELMASMALFSKIPSLKGAWRAIPLMLSMSTSLLILSAALKVISSMNMSQMLTGLIGIAGGMAVLITALHLMPQEKKFKKASKAIRSMSISLLILSGALKIIGSMKWEELGKGLTGVAVGLGIMVGALHLLPKDMSGKSLGLIGMATALVIMSSALKNMGSMDWMSIARGLTALAGTLVAMTIALRAMPKNMVTLGLGLIGVAAGLAIMAKVLKTMGSMSWESIGKGLTLLGGSLLILSLGLLAMKKSLTGAAALLVAAAALTILIVPLKVLGNMKWESIIKALVTLAGTFIIIGVAGAALSAIVPAILGLAGSVALFGIGAVALGVGLGLVATGITLLATAVAGGATAIVAGLTVIVTGILNLIPSIISILGDAILSFCKVIKDCAPAIVDSVLVLIAELLKSFATYIPLIGNSLFDLLIGVLDVLAERMPELINSAVKLLNNFFVGVANALKNVDGTNLLKGAVAVAIMSGLVYVLAGVGSMVGPAMLGLLGVGALIAELALILAAIGGLAQIPGLSWLIEEGGNLLGKVGTAIGQFVGGIVGGIAQGFTNSLPKIGLDLSAFMTNVKPFIDTAKTIDGSVLKGVSTLVKTMLLVTGADIVQSIASFLTGKNSMAKFGEQLVPFGESLREYGDAVAGTDAAAITASAEAAKGLAQVANALPKSGGLAGLFGGKKDLTGFATQLVPFGKALKEYSQAVFGIDASSIASSATAAKALAQMADTIPNQGGMVAWFTGDNSLANFAEEMVDLGIGLKNFSVAITGIVPENIIGAANAAKALAEMMSVIPNTGGMVAWFTGENSVSRFGDDLVALGAGLNSFATVTANIVPDNIIAASTAAKALAEMMGVIPNTGGMVAWFTGENSVSKFSDDLVALGTGLNGFATATAGIVPDNIVAAANAAKALAQMADTIPNQGGMVAWFTGDNSVSKFAEELPALGTGIKSFSDAVMGINAENITAAATAAKSLADMFSVIPNEGGIKAWFTGESAVTKFADKLPDVGKGIKGFSDAVVGIDPTNTTAAATAAKTLAEMTETTPKKTDKLVSFGENLVKFATKLKTYFENTAGITTETITTTTNAIESVKTVTTGFDSASITSASKSLDALVKTLKGMNKVSTKSVKGFSDAMTEIGKINVTAIITAFDNAESKLKTAGKNVVTTIQESIKSNNSKLKTAGENLIDKLVEGLTKDNKSLKTACKTVVTNSANAIKSYNSEFYNAGSHLVNGFANGISMNSYKAVAKARAMANAAETAAREELKINSPSKVFKEIGSGVPEGFALGISMFGSAIKHAIGDMGDTAITSTGDMMSRLVDTINTDIDSQPTIRPVLDLSDIQAGANRIGGMFNSVGIGANLNAVSASMSTRIQNGVNDNVVMAIDELRKDLNNLPKNGDTYNFDGITYDDGSNIRDAVQAIVRAAKVERRT